MGKRKNKKKTKERKENDGMIKKQEGQISKLEQQKRTNNEDIEEIRALLSGKKKGKLPLLKAKKKNHQIQEKISEMKIKDETERERLTTQLENIKYKLKKVKRKNKKKTKERKENDGMIKKQEGQISKLEQ